MLMDIHLVPVVIFIQIGKMKLGKQTLLYANENWEQEWGGKTVFN